MAKRRPTSTVRQFAMTNVEAAERLGVGLRTVERLRAEGTLPTVRLGRALTRLSAEGVERYLEDWNPPNLEAVAANGNGHRKQTTKRPPAKTTKGAPRKTTRKAPERRGSRR